MSNTGNYHFKRYANKVMHQAIKTITEVAGLSTLDNELPYDRMIKDSIGLMAQSVSTIQNKSVGSLYRYLRNPISIWFVASQSQLLRHILIITADCDRSLENYFKNCIYHLSSFMKTTTISKLLSPEPNLEEFMHPKLVHFIAEHAHPSLHVCFF